MIKRPLVILRRSSQIFFSLLFVYILWSTTYPLQGALSPEIFFKTDPLLMGITSISERVVLPGLLYSALLIFLTMILGRFFCGWVCPFGAIIDAVGALNRYRNGWRENLPNKMRLLKYIILTIVLMCAVVGLQVAWILDPVVVVGRFVSLNLIPSVTLLFSTIFKFLIKDMHMYGPVLDLYRALKPSILGVKAYYVSYAWVLFLFFAVAAGASYFIARFWCRAICPLGALYGIFSKFALLRRVVTKCSRCHICTAICRTGAIRQDASYIKQECVLCMDCIYVCPQKGISFSFGPRADKPKEADDTLSAGKVSRKNFLLLMLSSIFLTGFKWRRGEEVAYSGNVIRPPAALKEGEFLQRCVRCGNCMKVCITNGLQPVMLQSGLEGIWTPQLVPEIGYCEYQCALCGNTCPTGAIPALTVEAKKAVRLGLAEIDKSLCIPWAENKECIVCQEHCPISEKAIRLENYAEGEKGVARPYIDPSLCIGCGICQNKCPVRPIRAIRVSPRNCDRT